MKLKQLDIFAMLVAALCHDYKHPGTNNLLEDILSCAVNQHADFIAVNAF
ncbi:hypothetical protein [Ralstonia pseudosolanacearum]